MLGRRWQPYESHIPYLLQLKIDFNLAGMAWLRLGAARFREPLPEGHSRQRPGWAAQRLEETEEAKGGLVTLLRAAAAVRPRIIDPT